MGLLAGWPYYSDITVANGSADYQTKITVYYGSGTNGENVVYCNSLCQADFDDLRFAAADGTTLLDYWIESYIASTSAVVHVQNNSTPDTTLRMYYGKADATGVSSIQDTFIAGDEFTDGDYTSNPVWTVVQGTWAVAAGILAPTSTGTPDEVNTPATLTAFRLRARCKTTTEKAFIISVENNNRSTSYQLYAYSKAGIYIQLYENSATVLYTTAQTIDTNYHILELTRDAASLFNILYDNVNKGSVTDSTTTSFNKIAFESHGSIANSLDWIFAAKYAATEPTFTFGSQQVAFQPFRNVYPHILAH